MFDVSEGTKGQGNDFPNKIAWDGRVDIVEFLKSGHETYFDEGHELGGQRLESSHSLEADAKYHNWISSFLNV